MLNHQTLEKLHALRLTGMADAYRQQMEDAEMAGLSFEERFGLLVDRKRQTNPGVRCGPLTTSRA
jgi:hypothetical protein